MLIDKMHLKFFRNHTDFDIKFSPGINVIWGKNGVGKTSILEAVYILSIGKYYGFLGKFKKFKTKLKTNNRLYIDSSNSNKISEKIYISPLISKEEAYKKYTKLEM